jgi:transposase
MPKARLPYPAEFRQKIVDLVRSGRSVKELAAQFEPSEQTIRNWLAQADANEGKRKDLLSSAEREELVRLRRENRQLKTEREILAKATAWFAREADTKPKKSSGS